MINRVIIAGRLTRDPEIRSTTTNKKVASFSVAVDRRFKSEDQTADFFRVSAWGTTAEFLEKYIQKGRLVLIEGRLQSRKYTDKNGNDREVVEIVADSVNPLDRPRDSNTDEESSFEARSNIVDAETDEYDPSAKTSKAKPGNKSKDADLDDYDPFAEE